MKLKDVIDNVKRLKPNNLTEPDLIGFISKLDGNIHQKIYSLAADYTGTFTPYAEGNENITLLVPFPYDDIYEYYLSAMIDKLNEEINGYNNNMALYNEKYDDFAAYYRRNHVPKRGY